MISSILLTAQAQPLPTMSDPMTPGETRQLNECLRRLIAPNPGLMTGPGTNTYFIGKSEVAVVDPGPVIDAHLERILADAGGDIRYIIATHTHPDHSPAVTPLAERCGATVIGLPAPDGAHQDKSFRPDIQPADGENFAVDGIELQLLHTPGHASNHICVFLPESGWLLTGDHIINGSTVVIDPPDGSMSAYLKSLARLRALPPTAIAGGHGEVFDSPLEAIDWLIDHRLRREKKVLSSIEQHPDGNLAELVRIAYDEVDDRLHRLAERSLLAHLIKLEEDGVAARSGDRWVLR